MKTVGKNIGRPSGRNPTGTSFWEFPKGSGVRISETINRSRGQDYGVSYKVVIPRRLTGNGRVRKQFPLLETAMEFASDEVAGKEQFGQRYF
ncbi:uncharacterized protein METZ01_LOCUS373048, partial [marine metagenome]